MVDRDQQLDRPQRALQMDLSTPVLLEPVAHRRAQLPGLHLLLEHLRQLLEETLEDLLADLALHYKNKNSVTGN